MATLTKSQAHKRARANDKSKDWRQWTARKCAREAERDPKLREQIREGVAPILAKIEALNAGHATKLRLVDDGYTDEGTMYLTAVCATLAHHFNMRPDEVADLPMPDLYGLVRAYTRSKAAPETPMAKAASAQEPFIPNARQRAILDKLKGRAFRAEALAAELKVKDIFDRDRGSGKRGGIGELQRAGRVKLHPRLGYYRPDVPPAVLAE